MGTPEGPSQGIQDPIGWLRSWRLEKILLADTPAAPHPTPNLAPHRMA